MSTRTSKIYSGLVLQSFSYGKYEIIEYKNACEVKIRFMDTGYESIFHSSQVKNGLVKDRLFKSVCGVACIGDGAYSKSKDKKVYSIWNAMIERCYSVKAQEKQPTYIGCTVCDEWLNFQNYAKWYYKECPDINLDFHVDKDLKFFGNKVYSPENCLFVSRDVNNFTEDSARSRGSTMIGVSFYKSRNKYEAYCKDPIRKNRKKLGYFSREIDAHIAWRMCKSSFALELAMVQSNENVKNALLEYKRLIDENIIHKY